VTTFLASATEATREALKRAGFQLIVYRMLLADLVCFHHREAVALNRSPAVRA
jgi:hypothetical protein